MVNKTVDTCLAAAVFLRHVQLEGVELITCDFNRHGEFDGQRACTRPPTTLLMMDQPVGKPEFDRRVVCGDQDHLYLAWDEMAACGPVFTYRLEPGPVVV